jgi:formylglycine-generating enzyme required for sulfatase activity
MGSPSTELGRGGHEGTPREVVIDSPLYLGMHEVMVGHFRQFAQAAKYETEMEKSKQKQTWQDPGYPVTDVHPVVCVTANDARAFCDWLSKKEGKTYRLPHETEWEYACRAGTPTVFSFGNDASGLHSTSWFRDNSQGKSQPIGKLAANPWGFHDLHGNVWELTTNPADNSMVIRGGSYLDGGEQLRSANRTPWQANKGQPNVGFRVALMVSARN